MQREDFIHHELHLVTGVVNLRPYCPCGWISTPKHTADEAMESFKDHLNKGKEASANNTENDNNNIV